MGAWRGFDAVLYRNLMVRYWVGEPEQVRGDDSNYRRYIVKVAKQAIASEKGERHVPTEYIVHRDGRQRPSLYLSHIVGSYIYFKTTLTGWQLTQVVA